MRALCLLFVLTCGLLDAGPVLAQRPHTPGQGTAERTAILDAARTLVREQFHPAGPIQFNVRGLDVLNDWALLTVEPRAPSGALLPEFEATCQCDCEIVVLLQRRGRRWTTADAHFDPCDAAVYEWPHLHGAPAGLFEHTTPAPETGVAHVSAPSGSDPWLALRSEPSIEHGRRLARMPHGALVEVLGCQGFESLVDGTRGHWCRVRYDGRVGWAFDAFLASGG